MSVAGTDLSLTEHANRFASHHDGWEDAARTYAQISEPLFLAGVLLLIAAGLVLRRPRILATGLLAGLASGAALLLAGVLSAIADRPRPFVAHPQIHAFLAHGSDAGFPSDHATAAFAIAGVLLLRHGLRTTPILVAAGALAVSRVVIGLHYPSDVLAGAVLGLLVAAAVCAVAARPWVTGPADGLARRWPVLRPSAGG